MDLILVVKRWGYAMQVEPRADLESQRSNAAIQLKVQHSPWSKNGFCLDVDLCLPSSGITMIYGPSGSGKTTLLRCLAGLEKPKSAFISIAGRVWQSNSLFVPAHSRSIGYVFQEASLFSHLTAQQNLDFSHKQNSKARGKKSIPEVVELMGIESALKSKPDQLSGGERQRVAIARALLLDPEVLLLDEPLASLDKARKQEILPYLEAMQNETKIPVIYVTHSDEEVTRLADYLVVLDSGLVKKAGPQSEVMSELSMPMSALEDQSAVFNGRIVGRDEKWGLLTIRFEGGELQIKDNGESLQTSTKVRVRASDVSIALSDHADSSIVNRLQAEIISINPANDDSTSLLKLKIGSTVILSKMSAFSVDRLAVKVGQLVWAQLKAVAIPR